MKFKKLFFSLALAALAMAPLAAYAQAPPVVTPPRQSDIGTLQPRDTLPPFSSPSEQRASNGDRVSPYPPYYHPTQ